MMKKLLLPALALTALLLAGCGTSTGSKTRSTATTAQSATASASCPMLTKMGISAAKLAPLSGKMECLEDNTLVSLTDDQARQLLGEVMHFDMFDPEEGIDGIYSLAGARELPGRRSLLLFHIEFGDGAAHSLAIYDSNGRMTDFLDLGAWYSVMPGPSEDFEPDHGRAYHELAYVEFDDQKPEFTLKRDYAMSDWVDEDGEMKFTDIHWELLKDYHYSIDADGHFAQLDTDIDKKGDVDATDALLDEISDLHYLPATDSTRMDKLLALTQRPDTKKLLADPEGMAKYRLQGVMQAAFEQNGQVVLTWLASHRNAKPVINVLEQLFANGWLRKDRMTQELAKMPQGEARDWLERLTAQWGPSDAVG